MAFVTSKTTACVCAFCAAEMAGESFRNLSEKLPAEGACPRLWCRAETCRKNCPLKGLAPVFGVEPSAAENLLEKVMPHEIAAREASCNQGIVTNAIQ